VIVFMRQASANGTGIAPGQLPGRRSPGPTARRRRRDPRGPAPPRSNASIYFGTGLTTAEPGSAQRLELVVSDLEAARDDLIGVEVSELFHRGDSGLMPGPDPERRSYLTYTSFSDPDGNGWLLQEVTNRLPGRLWED
jgi:hypothetical protein